MNPFWSGFMAGGFICTMLTIIILGIIDILKDRKRFREMKDRMKAG